MIKLVKICNKEKKLKSIQRKKAYYRQRKKDTNYYELLD